MAGTLDREVFEGGLAPPTGSGGALNEQTLREPIFPSKRAAMIPILEDGRPCEDWRGATDEDTIGAAKSLISSELRGLLLHCSSTLEQDATTEINVSLLGTWAQRPCKLIK